MVDSLILLKLVDQLIGLRVEDEETEGIDLVLYDEQRYDLEITFREIRLVIVYGQPYFHP